MNWVKNLDEKVLNYLEELKKTDSEYAYYPVKSGLTDDGKKLELGFSCYALKILKILNQIDTFSEKKIDNWAKYINSFQSNKDSFFIDNEYLKSFKNQLYSKRCNTMYSHLLFNFKIAHHPHIFVFQIMAMV